MDQNVNFINRAKKNTEDEEVHFSNGGRLLSVSSRTPEKWSKNRVFLLITLIALLLITIAFLLLLFDRRSFIQNSADASYSRTTLLPTTTFEQSTQKSRWKDFRLPISLKPMFYDIRLEVNVEENYFSGTIQIVFKCITSTNVLVIHKGTAISVFRETIRLSIVTEEEGSNLRNINIVGDPEYYEPNSFYIFNLQNFLVKSHQYKLTFKYTSNFSSSLNGLYRTRYETTQGPRYVVASFLSPIKARDVFPCFDEPALKANFTITIVHPYKYTALSNMPSKPDKITRNGWTETTFQTTPKMSTYLLAFVVSQFVSKGKVLREGVEFRVWSREEAIEDTEYALTVGQKLFNFLEEYSGFQYPISKLDMIALPESQASGMENWGLITFAENIFFKSNQTSATAIQYHTFIISHELSHQWYSNLVTQDFWHELWLKECFANLLGFLAVDHVNPSWNAFQDSLFIYIAPVMKLDSLATSHPVISELTTSSQILDNFDEIAYFKSTAVVRMLYGILGDEIFKSGMQEFLRQNAYSNAGADDIWEALDGVMNHSVFEISLRDLMNPWLRQAGYPLLMVERQYRRRTVTFTQELYLLDPSIMAASPYGYKWDIPVTWVSSSVRNWTHPKKMLISRTASKTVKELPNLSDNQWLFINVNRTGYFRTLYDDQNLQLIIEQLNNDHEAIPVTSRAALIDDAFSLAYAGLMNYSTVLNLIGYMKAEREPIPWKVMFSNIEYIESMLQTTSTYGIFKKFMLDLIIPTYNSFRWNVTETPDDRILQAHMLKYACRYGHKPCVQAAKKIYKMYGNCEKLSQEYCSVVMSTALSDPQNTEVALASLKKSSNFVRNKFLITVMSGSREPWVLNSLLEYALDTDVIRKEEAIEIFKYVARNPVGGTITWNFFRSNWDLIQDRYAHGLFQLEQIITGITVWFNTRFQLSELQSFSDDHVDDLKGLAGSSALPKALDVTKINIEWMENKFDQLKESLEKYFPQSK